MIKSKTQRFSDCGAHKVKEIFTSQKKTFLSVLWLNLCLFVRQDNNNNVIWNILL